MKHIKRSLVFFSLVFATNKIWAQANPYISVLPANSGIVAVGATNELLITVGNTLAGSIPVSKLRPVIQVPASVEFLPDAQQDGLPPGWTILSNTGQQLRICNSGDVIPGQTSRNIILKIQGLTIAPAQTFSGQINFGNGTTCAAGTSVSGNNTADDFATSTIQVIAGPTPVTLSSFSASLAGCVPTLHWKTANEFSSSHFEIERFYQVDGSWRKISQVLAAGNSSTVNNYSYTDNSSENGKLLYRLKMVDTDGNYKYSNVLPVQVNCKTMSANVFPNPVMDGRLYISLAGTRNRTEALLVAASGQVVLRTDLINGTNLVNVKNIASGIYLVRIKEAGSIDKQWKVIVNN